MTDGGDPPPASAAELAAIERLAAHYKAHGHTQYLRGLRMYYAARKAGAEEGGGYTPTLVRQCLQRARIAPYAYDLAMLPAGEPCPGCGMPPVHPATCERGELPHQRCTGCGALWFVEVGA